MKQGNYKKAKNNDSDGQAWSNEEEVKASGLFVVQRVSLCCLEVEELSWHHSHHTVKVWNVMCWWVKKNFLITRALHLEFEPGTGYEVVLWR